MTKTKTIPSAQPVPQQIPATFMQELPQAELAECRRQQSATIPQSHHCAPEMLDFVHGLVKKRMFGKDEWVEVQRCRFCKELYINRVKI